MSDVGQVHLFVCVCLCVCVCVCVVFGRSVYVCVSYAECGVGVDLLDRVSDVGQVHLFCVCVCVCVCACVCMCLWCSTGSSMCLCGMRNAK